MTVYYARADGSAANIAAATGPASDATACMDLGVFHAATFAAGDIVYFSSQGGDFVEVSTVSTYVGVLHITQAGTVGSRLTVAAVTGETPVIAAESAAAGVVYHSGADYATVSGFRININALQGVRFVGTSGTAGAGYTNVFTGGLIVGTAGSADDNDGVSGDNSAQLIASSTTVRDVSDIGNNNTAIQALTAHSTAKLKAVNVNVYRCNIFAANIDQSSIEIDGGIFSHAYVQGFDNGGTGSTLTIENAVIRNTVSAVAMFKGTIADATSVLTVRGCDIRITAGGLNQPKGTTLIENCLIDITGSSHSILVTSGTMTLKNNTVIVQDSSSDYLKTATGASFVVRGNKFLLRHMAAGDSLLNATGSGGTGTIEWVGNIHYGNNIQGNHVTIAGGTGRIDHNTFYNTCLAGNANRTVNIIGDVGISVQNNIFYGCLGTNGPIYSPAYTGTTIGHNSYSGGTANKRTTYGDAATSNLTDPAFVDTLNFIPGEAGVNAGGTDLSETALYRGLAVGADIPMGAVPNQAAADRVLAISRVERP